MPTYELICDACDRRFEIFRQRMLRDEDRVCEHCGSTEVRTGFGGGIPVSRSGSAPAAPAAPRGCVRAGSPFG